MQRVCFLFEVRQDRIAGYRGRSAAVWPEMREAPSATGWHNYSLFLRDDGLLVGYPETEDFEAAKAGMEATGVNARRQAERAPFFESLGGSRPDEAMRPLTEVFHLARRQSPRAPPRSSPRPDRRGLRGRRAPAESRCTPMPSRTPPARP